MNGASYGSSTISRYNAASTGVVAEDSGEEDWGDTDEACGSPFSDDSSSDGEGLGVEG